jgi:intein/homing endonuclease
LDLEKKNLEVVHALGKDLIAFYIKHPSIAAYDLLRVDLAPIQRLVFEDMWFKNYVITVAGRGVGKSASTDSLSFIPGQGLCYLNEVFPPIPSFLNPGETLEVADDNKLLTSVGFRAVKRVSLEKSVDGRSLKTVYGYTHRGTPHHPLLTIDDECNLCYKKLEDFSPGDYVCIERGTDKFGANIITKDDSYLIGLFIGDGCIVDKYNHVSITSADLEIKEFCENYCKINGVSYRIDEDNRSEGLNKIIFKQFDYFFDKYDIDRVYSYYKCVPKSIRAGNFDTQINFLRGLFDSDGSFNGSSVDLSSTSYKLINEVQIMLLNLGIVSRVREKKTESNYGKAFILEISSTNLKVFNDIIGFRLTRKSIALNTFLENRKYNPNLDIIPGAKELCTSIAKSYRRNNAKSPNDRHTPSLRYYGSNSKEYTYSRLSKFLYDVYDLLDKGYYFDSESKDKIVKLKHLLYKGFYFDKVKSVEDWSGDCYDFEMDMCNDNVEPNYFCNGFINHNTFLLGLLSTLSCMLYPGYRVGLIAPVFRQCLPIIPNRVDTFWTSDGMYSNVEDFYGAIHEGSTSIQSLESQETILNKWPNPEQECAIISTKKGYGLAGTLGHKVLSIDSNSDLVDVKLRDLKVGDFLAIKKGFNYFGDDDKLPDFTEFESTWRDGDCSIPNTLTEDMSYWLGLLVGDGCVSISSDSRKYRVDFVNEDKQLLDFFGNYLRDEFSLSTAVDCRNRKNNVYEIQCFSRKLTAYLLKCGVTSTKARDKCVPAVIKKASKNCVASFISGLMDTDGTASCEVSLSTSSIKLAKEVQSILLNFGILASFGKDRDGYKIRIIDRNSLSIFRNEIGFRLEHKKEGLDKLLALCKTRVSNSDTIPVSKAYNELIRQCKLSVCRGSEESVLLGKIKNNIDHNEAISRERTEILLDLAKREGVLTFEYYKIKKLIDFNLSFVKITNIEYVSAPSIDIEVANEHRYWANGFINHNSKMIFSEVEKLYAKSSLLREATEKKPTRGSDTCYLKFKAIGGSNGSYIEALPLGDGCLTSSNYVTYCDRFGTIADAHDVSVEQNHYIDRKEVVWGNGVFRESDRSLCNGIKNTIKIKTSKGFSSEATPNHMFKVVRNGEVVWCRFDEMSVGDRILIDRSKRWHNGQSEITEDQAYALGLMIGDGSWTNKYRLRYATTDSELIDHLEKGTGLSFYKCSDGVHYNHDSINDVKDWLSRFNLDVCYTLDKKIPNTLLAAPKRIMSSCLRGIYDTDGHVQVSTDKGGVGITIGLTNTSEKLIDQIQFILLHYGIVACKTERNCNEKWNTSYELLITGADVKIFYDEVGFRLKRKQDALDYAVNLKTRWFNYEDIPGVRDDMLRISSENRVKKGLGCKESRYVRSSVIKDSKYITQYMAECFIRTYGHLNDSAIDRIKTLASSDIYYDEIIDVCVGEDITYDIHVPNGNEYCANGFFSHNSKIRGSRFYLIIVDELAQVPDKVLDMVVRPMAATTLEPMENVRRLERQKRLIEAGLATEDDFQEETVNKMVMASSGYYKFNHMWRRMKDHWSQMDKYGEDSPYVVHQIPYWDMPPGFLDLKNIEEAKRIMSESEFRMEYEAAMISDSEGFFKASLLESCTMGSGFSLELKGQKGEQYILGVDPNQGGAGANTGVVVIKLGHINKIVNVLELKGKTTQELTKSIQDVCDVYNVVHIFMDKGGGGKAVCDLLEEGYDGYEPIIDITNKDNDDKPGRHILEMVNFNPAWISDANFTTKALLENKTLRFPEPPLSTLDAEGLTYERINTMKSQMLNIVVSQTPSGLLHFDTPKKGQKKDLYSALILGAHGVRLYEKMTAEQIEIAVCNRGLIRRHEPGSRFVPAGAVSSNVSVDPRQAALLKPRKKKR